MKKQNIYLKKKIKSYLFFSKVAPAAAKWIQGRPGAGRLLQ